MKELYIDEPANWKTRILRQIRTADPVGMGRKSSRYTILEYSVLARLYAHSDWINCMYLAQYPRLPFCGLLYIQLLHLWCGPRVNIRNFERGTVPCFLFLEIYYNSLKKTYLILEFWALCLRPSKWVNIWKSWLGIINVKIVAYHVHTLHTACKASNPIVLHYCFLELTIPTTIHEYCRKKSCSKMFWILVRFLFIPYISLKFKGLSHEFL